MLAETREEVKENTREEEESMMVSFGVKGVESKKRPVGNPLHQGLLGGTQNFWWIRSTNIL